MYDMMDTSLLAFGFVSIDPLITDSFGLENFVFDTGVFKV